MAPIDLRWLGHERRIAAWRVGEVLVDCGPATCLDRLVEAVGSWRPRALLLTHVHFDHAGAAGALVRRWPDLEVFVHRSGVRHLADPARLLASARRVFGADFDRLFGGLEPVPAGNLTALDGGEHVHGFDVLFTPGHAKHHVAYLHGPTKRAFVGDVAGVRLRRDWPVLPPTPPPDIDVRAWIASIDAIAAWEPRSLGLPHFGGVDDAAGHLRVARDAVEHHARLAAEQSQSGYVRTVERELGERLSEPELRAYERVVPFGENFVGLRRWIDERSRRAVAEEGVR